mmetsp:Transcript_8359/g.12776  ORF Transcript_8359/g.12776 Transcript_8359/m.12776 type:complete len:328 (+) Transcript_8359:194-1177(+)
MAENTEKQTIPGRLVALAGMAVNVLHWLHEITTQSKKRQSKESKKETRKIREDLLSQLLKKPNTPAGEEREKFVEELGKLKSILSTTDYEKLAFDQPDKLHRELQRKFLQMPKTTFYRKRRKLRQNKHGQRLRVRKKRSDAWENEFQGLHTLVMKFFEEQTRQSSNTIDVKRECSDARGTHEWRPDARGKKRKTCLEGSSCKVHRVHYMEEGIKSLHAHFLEQHKDVEDVEKVTLRRFKELKPYWVVQPKPEFCVCGFCQQAQNLLIGGKKLEKGPKKCIVHQEGEDAQEEAESCSEMPDSLYHLMGRALCKPQYHLENKTRDKFGL